MLWFTEIQGKTYTSESGQLQKINYKLVDTAHVLSYIRLSDKVVEYNSPLAILYLDSAFKIAKSIDFVYGKARSLEKRALIEMNIPNYPKALELLLEANELYTRHQLKYDNQSLDAIYIGSVYARFGLAEQAKRYADIASRLINTQKTNDYKIYLFNALGELYNDIGETQIAKKILQDNIAESKHLLSKYNHAMGLNFLARNYMITGKVDSAIIIAHLALRIYEDSIRESSGMYLYTLNQLGNLYLENNNYSLAQQYLLKGLHLKTNVDTLRWGAINVRDLAKLFIKKGEIKLAEYYAASYIKKADERRFQGDRRIGYKLITDVFVAQRKFEKAFYYQTKYLSLQDSLVNIEKSNIITNIYLNNLLRDDNDSLKNKNHQIESILKDKQIFQLMLIIISIVIFIFTIVVICLSIKYRIDNSLLQNQSKEILEKNEKLAAQNQLLETLNEDKNGIIGIVSHDLKAPINRIESMLQFIKMEGGFTKEQEEYIEIALKETANSKGMISKILESELNDAKDEPTKKTIELTLLIRTLMEEYKISALSKRIEILTTLPSHEIYSSVLESHLIRILDNLISNAIKFSLPDKSVHVVLYIEGSEIFIEVRDQGPGMTPEDLNNIYKKYQKLSASPTAGESSTGLGLHIVKKLVSEIQAEILVKSIVNEGTTFILKLKN